MDQGAHSSTNRYKLCVHTSNVLHILANSLHDINIKCQYGCQSCLALSQVDQAAHANLEAVLWRDTAFLAGLGVMDYSLLVGLDSNQHRLVIGIIDFIRQVLP